MFKGKVKDPNRKRPPRSPLPPVESEAAGRPLERAYRQIRRHILEGSWQPGEHLGEKRLSTVTGTSRTPVREALRRLAHEGLIVIGANHRNYVADFDPEEADVVFEIRARLESYAAVLASQRIEADELARLESLCDEMEALGPTISKDVVARFMDLNTTFHTIVINAARSRQLSNALLPILTIPLVLLKHFVWGKEVDISRDNQHHRELVAALKNRNSHWASTCMAAHINSSRPLSSSGRK